VSDGLSPRFVVFCPICPFCWCMSASGGIYLPTTAAQPKATNGAMV
jgi:hypothetical protein